MALRFRLIPRNKDFYEQFIQRLNSTFVTPIDREDIHALAKSLDDVMDAIDASARFVRTYKIKSVRYGAASLPAW